MTRQGWPERYLCLLSDTPIRELYSLAMQGGVDLSQQRVSGERLL